MVKKVLAIVENLPNNRNSSWGFVSDQLRALSMYCKITIIVTPNEPWHLGKGGGRKQKVDGLAYAGRLGDIPFYQPRFQSVPRYSYYWDDYSRMFAILGCVLRQRIEFDLIHAHFAYRTGYIAGKVAKALRKAMVLTVHGSDIHQQTRIDYPRRMWRDRTLKALGMSSRIIAVSRSLQQMVNQLGYGSKTCVIPSGFVGEYFKPQDQSLCRKRLGLSPRTRVLLYVGGMMKVKGTDLLPETISILLHTLDDLLLLMVGGGPMEEGLKKEFKARGLSKRVRFVGRLPNDQVGEYMNAADLLVLPSRNEGRPTVVAEALSCGRPVVATNVGGIRETLQNNSLGVLTEPENPAALAGAIVQCLERDWVREHLHSFAQQFTWANIVPRINEVYEEVLS